MVEHCNNHLHQTTKTIVDFTRPSATASFIITFTVIIGNSFVVGNIAASNL